MGRVDQHVYTEWRGGTCRVKWWTGGYHENGRKRYESKGGFADEAEAHQHGQDKLYEIRHGTHVSNRDGSTLFTDWLDDWLAAMDLGMLTQKDYRSIVEAHIRPWFARRTMMEIDTLLYRGFRKHVRGVVGEGRTRQIMMVLGMILDDAVPKLIKISPVERNGRRGRYVKAKKRKAKRDLAMSTVEALARNAESFFGFAGYVLVWTMAMTGMRPGELFGLTREYCFPAWPAADPHANPEEDEEEQERFAADLVRYGKGRTVLPAIRVERQVQHEAAQLHFMPPKYGSRRTLVIPPFLAEMIEQLLDSHDKSWVFPAVMGGSLGSVAFDSAYWRPIADGTPARKGPRVRRPRPEIPAVPEFAGKRMYLLRHGHKEWLDEDKHSRFAVESRMGHEVAGVEGTYSNVTVAMERDICASLQRRWERHQKRMGNGQKIDSHSFPISLQVVPDSAAQDAEDLQAS